MGKAIIRWVHGLEFVATDSTKHSVVLSAPDEANGTGMKPSELLLVSLGGCTAFDVVNILMKKRKRLVDVQVEVEGEQNPTPPWAFTRIHVHYIITGEGLTPREVEQAITLSHEKYCSVSATLACAVTITHDYEIVEPTLERR